MNLNEILKFVFEGCCIYSLFHPCVLHQNIIRKIDCKSAYELLRFVKAKIKIKNRFRFLI